MAQTNNERQSVPSGKEALCTRVCRLCEFYLSRIHSALCWSQCANGGRAFDACATVLIITEEISEAELDALN